MTHSEKNNVSTVKDRIFHRFMAEHSINNFIIENSHPDIQYTALEQAGVMAKLARLNDAIGFDSLADGAKDCIHILSNLEKAPWMDAKQEKKAANCIEINIALLELFLWLDAYGPRSADVAAPEEIN